MKEINRVFNKLKNTCDIEWEDDNKNAFYIYSCDKKYRLFVSYDINIVMIEKMSFLLKHKYWNQISHNHPGDYKNENEFYYEILKLCDKKSVLVLKQSILYSSMKIVSKKEVFTDKKKYKSNLFRKCYVINFR